MISTTIDNVYLFIYLALWVITLVVYRKRTKQVTLAFALLCLYAFMAPVCLYLYNSEYAYLYFEKELTLIGFIYLFIMIIMAIYPIIKVREESLKGIWLPKPSLLTVCCVCVSILSIFGIIACLPKLQEGFFIMLSGSEEIVGLYEDAKGDRMEVIFRKY